MRKWFVFFCVLSFFTAVSADGRFGRFGQYSIETNYQFGKILKHNKKFTPVPTEFTHGFELSFYKQTLGNKGWQRKMKYPELGFTFLFFRHGDNAYFGNAYLLLAAAKFWIVRSRYVDFHVKTSWGAAVVPKYFDLQKNPDNLAIGSWLNAATQIRLGLDLKPSPYFQITLGGSFTHYSNSAVQKPNLGINTPTVFLGFRVFPVVGRWSYNRSGWDKPTKRHEVMVRFSLAFQEASPYLGPKFPVYIGTVNYAFYTSIINKVLAGVSAEFNQGAYDFIGYYGNTFRYGRTASSMNASLFIGDEIMVGKVGMFFVAGAYVFNPRRDTPVYVKVGANYYFAAVGEKKTTKFFIGTNLKSHFFVAQHYEVSTGVAF